MNYRPVILLILVTCTRLLADDNSSSAFDSTWSAMPGIIGVIWVIRLIIHLSGGAAANPANVATADRLVQIGKYDEAEKLLKAQLRKTEKNAGKASLEAAVVMNQLGHMFVRSGKLSDAQDWYDRALTIEEDILGDDSLDLVPTLQSIANVKFQLQDETGAEPLLRKILLIREQRRPDSPDVARTLNQLGVVLGNLGKLPEAEASHRRALQIRLDKDCIKEEVCQSLDNLGWVLIHKGDHEAAEKAFRQSLDLGERAWGTASPKLLITLNNLGLVLLQLKHDFAQAESVQERRLAILESTHGKDSPELVGCLEALQDSHVGKGDFAAAAPVVMRIVALKEKELGPEHLDLAKAKERAAFVRLNLRETAEAEALQRQSLAVKEKMFEPNHAEIASTLDGLSLILLQAGKLDQAETTLRRALAIWEVAAGPDSLPVSQTLYNLAQALKAKPDNSAAEPLLWRALAIEEKAAGPDDPRVAMTLDSLASVRLALGDAAGAEPLLRQALAIVERQYGPKHPQVAFSSRALSYALSAKHEPGEAELLLRRAIEIYEGVDLTRHVAATCVELARLLHFTGRPAEAIPLYRRAIATSESRPSEDPSNLVQATGGLASLLEHSGDYMGARLLYERAVTTAAKTLGADHPQTVGLKRQMEGLLLKMVDSHLN